MNEEYGTMQYKLVSKGDGGIMSIESYQNIRNNSADNRLNQTVVLNKDRPSVASLFGMVKQFVQNRTQSVDKRAARNDKVKQNFFNAIKNEYGVEIAKGVDERYLQKLSGKSLKARDVRIVLDDADQSLFVMSKKIEGEISDPVKQLLGDELEACEKHLQGLQNRKFMAAHKLSKDEMTALLCLSGMVKNDRVNTDELLISLRDKKNEVTPITKFLDSALKKLPDHKGTVYTQVDLTAQDEVYDYLNSTGKTSQVTGPMIVVETLSPEDKREFGVPGKTSGKALISIKSDSGRKFQFGDISITNEFMVFMQPTQFKQIGAEKAPLLGRGALKVSFEEV